jgi:predicted glycogen debranching enzyme
LSPPGEANPFYLFAPGAEITPRHDWRSGLVLSVERYRGFDGLEDVLCAAEFSARLEPGAAITLLASTEADAELDGETAYAARRRHEEQVLARFRSAMPAGASDPPDAVERLALAADQFIVQRAIPGEAAPGRSVIAGYPWFADWGRDTMISLPGLALATGRAEIAERILRTFAHFLDRGMLPNRFPDEGQAPEYNTVDATLWYFEALRAYYEHTGDESTLADLYPSLEEIIHWHRRGTRYNIHVDPGDGLLYAGEAGVQLTWMDAKVDDWVVTPRIGKPVEINALWYNALRCMAHFARRLGHSPEPYERMAEKVQTSFARFWYAVGGYLYDLIDGPEGDDPSLRPNQVFAVSLAHSALDRERQKAVVDVCTQHLLTPYGLRSLAPGEAHYVGRYGGDRYARDGAYHQGTVWGWLIGPYVSAYLRVYAERESARATLRPLFDHLRDHGVGTLSEIFDGDPPFTPRGCFAQAWSVAEVLRAWVETGTRQR